MKNKRKGDGMMSLYEIGRELTAIQEREHLSVEEIFSCVPPEYGMDGNKLFRFLAAWNSLGYYPEGLVL